MTPEGAGVCVCELCTHPVIAIVATSSEAGAHDQSVQNSVPALAFNHLRCRLRIGLSFDLNSLIPIRPIFHISVSIWVIVVESLGGRNVSFYIRGIDINFTAVAESSL
jgi:hypothetical protein